MHNYKKSIDKVLTYIDVHLDEKQELETLAEIANLSKFHFHRIMKAHLNETLGNYINRVRLEKAAKLLRYSKQPIKEIAFQIGYETVSAFGKGFKKIFGVSPKAFRIQKDLTEEQKISSTMNEFQLVQTIKKINDIQVIFQQSKGKTGDKTTVENWEVLFAKAQDHNVLNFQSKFYGINWDDPEITPDEKVRYDACISIENKTEIEKSFSSKTIRGGKYLSFLYKGDYKHLGSVYDHIFRDWIIKMEYDLRDEPVFEHYINNKEITPEEDLLTEIYIPIK